MRNLLSKSADWIWFVVWKCVCRRVVRWGRPRMSTQHWRGLRVHCAVTATADHCQRRRSWQRRVSINLTFFDRFSTLRLLCSPWFDEASAPSDCDFRCTILYQHRPRAGDRKWAKLLAWIEWATPFPGRVNQGSVFFWVHFLNVLIFKRLTLL